MSDKTQRKSEEIQREYSGLCAKAGHIQYQIAVLQKDLILLNDTIRDLNLEFSSAKSAEDAAAAAPATTPTETTQEAQANG